MSNVWDQLDDLDDDDEGGQQQKRVPDGLRQHLKKLEKENAELRKSNDTLQKSVRQTAISQVLSAKGIDDKVAKLVPVDVEPTVEAVEKWLEDYGELFTPKKQSESRDDSAGGAAEGAEDEDDEGLAEYLAQMARLAQVNNGATPPASKAGDLLSQINSPDMTADKLEKLVNAAGGGRGSG